MNDKPEEKKEQPKEVPSRSEGEKAEQPKEKPKEEKPEQKTKPTKEETSACAKCGKTLKKKSWYYRNGKYYCNKRCWKQTRAKPESKGSKK